ncbi:nucleic acid-binding [Salvia divinorum]|uniref:Nucleic acid-binding n=1 Tax=Salvia divinorum TaxID=28513 RepID=A0ABD1HJE9_SALDI
MEFTFLADLKPTNTKSVVRARTVRIFEFLSRYGDKSNVKSLECIFHDRMGNRIQGRFQAPCKISSVNTLGRDQLFLSFNFM